MNPSASNPVAPQAPHSGEHFGPQRDFWWHRDFLDLMARRWRLNEAASLADIGCGLCHWSRLLYPYLKLPARFAGIDREQQWIDQAALRFAATFPDVPRSLFTFLRGDAASIPLPDDSFDVVTCQTVLMHVRDPKAALGEMVRILKPGGLLVCAEPNNLWSYVAFTSLTHDEPIEKLVQRFEFWLRCHRGRKAEGQGDHCIGDLLPGYFAEAGLEKISVCQSDRAASLFPPYATAEQQALIEDEKASRKAAQGPWNAEEVRKHLLLGGGTPEFFEAVYPEIKAKFNAEERAIDQGTFHASGGCLFYLVSGRKPVKE